MTNTRLNGWLPPTGTLTWHQPVTVEDSSRGVTACSLYGGAGAIAMWPNGTEVHYAVVPSMSTLMADNVITAPMIGTALSIPAGTGAGVERTTVFRTGGGIYFTVLASTSDTDSYWVRVYQADDPTDPSAGWSLLGTVEPGADFSGGSGFSAGGAEGVGQPLILPSGRWVLVATDSYRDVPLGTVVRGRRTSIFTSDDGGATWTKRVTYSHDGPLERAHHVANHVVQVPGTGDLLTARCLEVGGSGGVDVTDVVISSDDGDTWATASHTGDDDNFTPFLDNGTDVFGFNGFDADLPICKLVGTAWVEQVSIWDPGLPTGAGSAGDEGQATKFIVDSGSLWYFVGPYVAGAPGWFVGFVGRR